MKRVALLLFLAGWLVPMASAQDQDHVQVGAYGDYFRVTQTNTDLAGLGARAAVRLFPHVMLEGEMNYDFEKTFTEACTNCTALTVAPSNMKVLHGLLGPKFVAGRGRIHPFVTVKGGFINFRLDPRPPSFSGFTSSIDNLRANNVSGVLYPAAGMEGHFGPIGLRLEAGDEMYFAGGTHHNPRVAFGPFIRF